MTDRELGRAIGLGNAMRYAATTGTIAIRWEGARAPTVWAVEAAPGSSRRPRPRWPGAPRRLLSGRRPRSQLRSLGRDLTALPPGHS